MPKKFDAKVKERCVRQVLDHLPEYPSVTAAAEAVARREGVGQESVRACGGSIAGEVGVSGRRSRGTRAGSR